MKNRAFILEALQNRGFEGKGKAETNRSSKYFALAGLSKETAVCDKDTQSILVSLRINLCFARRGEGVTLSGNDRSRD